MARIQQGGKNYELDQTRTYELGREGRDIVVIGNSISRQHGKFYFHNGLWTYEDTSKFGTVLIKRAEGHTVYLFEGKKERYIKVSTEKKLFSAAEPRTIGELAREPESKTETLESLTEIWLAPLFETKEMEDGKYEIKSKGHSVLFFHP